MNITFDVTDVVLKTERLTLRAFNNNDLDDLFEYAKDKDVGPMAGWLPHKDKNESAEVLKMFIDGKCTFAIEFEGKVIGSIGLDHYNEKYFPELKYYRALDLGFVLSKDYWGKGLMPEAVKRVIQYLFEEVDVDMIICGYFPFNNQSKRVQEKLGFNFYKDSYYDTVYGETIEYKANAMFKDIPKQFKIVGEDAKAQYSKYRIACRGIVVLDGHLLVTKLNNGIFMLPGGGIEDGETLKDCVVREIEEETGIIVKPLKHFATVDERYDDFRFINHYLVCEAIKEGNKKLTEEEKEYDLESGFVDIDEIMTEFGNYDAYKGINEDQRGIYLREYAVLNEYFKSKKNDKV